MFYTIYKITNKINGKIYIGKHQTKDLNDGYMGSGKHLKRSIEKYGIENFEKEILFQFDNEYDMNIKEAEIVNEEFVLREDTYNICIGGQGGFGYINSTGLRNKGHDAEMYSRISETLKNKPNEVHNHPNRILAVRKLHTEGKIKYDTFKGKFHSDETKAKIGLSNSGQKGPNGTMWITDGTENKKIKKEIDVIPEGWYKGRIVR